MLINKTLTKLSALIIGSMLLTILNTVSAKQVTLNLKQTDIHSLVETVAEVTGKNFVVDPRVSAEVNSDFLRELGAEGFFRRVLGNNTLGPGISSLGNGALESAIKNPVAGKGLSLSLANLTGKNQWAVLLKALEGNSSTNILSTPTIVTLDNHEANFVVAQNVPFVTGQYTNKGEGNSSVNPFQTIQRQNVGLTLKITPQINDGSSIRLYE